MVAQTRRAMSRTETGITWRSVAIGLVLSSGLCALTPYNDYVVQNTYLAGNHFPVGAAFVLLALGLINLLASRFRGPLLHKGELAVIYVMIVVTSGIPSSGLLRYLLPSLVAPRYLSDPGNQWDTLIWPRLPEWFRIESPETVNWFWEGLPEGATVPWSTWMRPLFHAAILVGALWLMMVCLAALLRKQWVDRERLAFPLVQFPLAVIREETHFLRSRVVWIAAGGVFLVHLINGLRRYYPALPGIPTFWSLDPYLVNRPWEAAQPLYMAIYFSGLGFAYLLSQEVAAGFWMCVLLVKIEGVVLSMLGYEGTSSWSGTISQFTTGQQMGGLLVVGAVLTWSLRGTWAEAFRASFRGSVGADDAAEPLGYRFAALGILVSGAIATAWLCAAGMSLLSALALLGVFVCMCLVLTRIIAEAGMLMVNFEYWPANYLTLFGASAFSPGSLTGMTLLDCTFSFDMRELLLPSVLNGFCLAEQSGVSTRKLSGIIGVALLLCLVVSIFAFLSTIYSSGALNNIGIVNLSRQPREIYGRLAERLLDSRQSPSVQWTSLASGGGLVAALVWLRLSFVWWPIHPLGFVMATSWAGLNLWFSLFLGWLIKLLTIRYTGLRGYVRLRPLFLGLILGDVLGAVFWICVGFFTKVGIMVTVN